MHIPKDSGFERLTTEFFQGLPIRPVLMRSRDVSPSMVTFQQFDGTHTRGWREALSCRTTQHYDPNQV